MTNLSMLKADNFYQFFVIIILSHSKVVGISCIRFEK